ncbi:MAG: RDD family protein [Marinicellaceae bacterium]
MTKTPIWKHFAAFIYDVFPIAGLLIVTSMIVLILRGGVEVERFSSWFSLLLLSEIALYYVYSWKIGGQTLGMRAWKIKIIPTDINQNQISWNQATLRFVAGLLSTLLVGLGLFWKILSPSKKSWMDLISQSETTHIP